EYELTNANDYDKRVHIKRFTDKDVPAISFGATTPSVAAVNLAASPDDQLTTFDYNAHGQVALRTGPDLRADQPSYDPATGAAGTVLKMVTTSAPLFAPTETHFNYDTTNANAANTIIEIGRKDAVTLSGSG